MDWVCQKCGECVDMVFSKRTKCPNCEWERGTKV